MLRVSAKSDKDQDLVKLGHAIRAHQKQLSMTQEALADYSGIDRSHMGKIERGERNVTFLNIPRIARALQCPPSQLLIEAEL